MAQAVNGRQLGTDSSASGPGGLSFALGLLHVCVCVCVCAYVRTYARTCVCIKVCVQTDRYIHMYIDVHIVYLFVTISGGMCKVSEAEPFS